MKKNLIIDQLSVLQLDRSLPFDPVTFLGEGWSIDEQDERALGFTVVDFAEVEFETGLAKQGEKTIKGECRLERLKKMNDRIRLDAVFFKELWKNRDRIPIAYRKRIMFCDGTTLIDPQGHRRIMFMIFSSGVWCKNTRLISDGYGARSFSMMVAA